MSQDASESSAESSVPWHALRFQLSAKTSSSSDDSLSDGPLIIHITSNDNATVNHNQHDYIVEDDTESLGSSASVPVDDSFENWWEVCKLLNFPETESRNPFTMSSDAFELLVGPGSYLHDPSNISQLAQKKPRLDIEEEDVLQKQFLQARPVVAFAAVQAKSATALPVELPYASGIFARRLMQYLYHLRQRPSEALQCEICGSKSGKGFEATFEALPRLYNIKFGSGVIDELLYLDMPREFEFRSGTIMLEYKKAVQESVHEQFRVVLEGQLRIIFTRDLKILSWDFVLRVMKNFYVGWLSHRWISLAQVPRKCRITIAEIEANRVSS